MNTYRLQEKMLSWQYMIFLSILLTLLAAKEGNVFLASWATFFMVGALYRAFILKYAMAGRLVLVSRLASLLMGGAVTVATYWGARELITAEDGTRKIDLFMIGAFIMLPIFLIFGGVLVGAAVLGGKYAQKLLVYFFTPRRAKDLELW